MNRFFLFCIPLCSFLFCVHTGYCSERELFFQTREDTWHCPTPPVNVFKDAGIRGLQLNNASLDENSYHVFSHGKPGALLINGAWLNAREIAIFLKSQTASLSFRNLYIYGCEFGKGETGRAAVSYIGKELGVTVSASDDLTGKDGDWELEVGGFVSVTGLENFYGNLQCGGTVGGTASGDDFDGDGICNDVDLDDDNDGVPDAVESPGCFYTETEAKVITSVTTALTLATSVPISNSYDGNTSTQSSFVTGQDWVNKSIFEITPATPLAISSVNFDVGSWPLSSSTSSTFKLQGWNGSSWVDLSVAMYSTGTGASDFSISNTLEVGTKYAKYRIVGVAGTCSNGGIQEISLTAYHFISSAYPKSTCSADLDNDSKYNHQDLDSDGDGSPDLAEAGVSPTTDVLAGPPANSQLDPNGTDDNSDGLNDSVDPDKDGVVNYILTYTQYALNTSIKVSADLDGDGVTELLDYDDDNDGIPDVVESPGCFYTEAEAKVITAVTTELTLATNVPISYSYDGDISTQSSFVNAQNWVNKSIFEITPATPLALSSVNFDVGSWALSTNTSSTFKLQGWSGASWVDLSGAMYSTGTTDFSINNTLQVGKKYEKYRIVGVAGTCSSGGIFEISLTAYQYAQALHPKSTCAADVDSDGIVNHQDLDSDGDGCADAVEGGGGFTTSNLKESDVPKGNSGGTFNGIATFGVDDNLGNTVNANGIPTIAGSGQSLGQSQIAAGTACAEIEPCTVNVGGKVYKDSDGASNGVNGTAVNGVTTGLYMSLVSGTTVVDVTGVLADGTYSFTAVATGTYKLVLGTSSLGSSTADLPGSATAVAEGGAIVADVSMGDGTPDGVTEIVLTCPQSNAYTHVDFGVTGGPFPVTLISFNAQYSEQGARLTWRTTEEKNFDRFQIEYSESPKTDFSLVGEVKGGGAEYVYIDPIKRGATSYYRLKMMDTDGTYAYSRIVSVQSQNNKDQYRMYPNPSQGRITYIFTSGTIESYKIYDGAGKEISAVMTDLGGKYEFRFADHVAAGLYIITYKTSGRLISQKFILND